MKALSDIAARFERLAAEADAECRNCGEFFRPVALNDERACPECARELAAEAGPSREERMAAAGVPIRFRGEFDPARVVEPAKPALDWRGDPWALWLGGPNGSGKSHLAAHLLTRWPSGLWVRAGKVAGCYYDRGARVTGSDLERAAVLVIDELGRAHRGHAWEAVGELIAARWDDARPTVITTNLDLAALREAEPAIWDRVRDGLAVRVVGPSQRGRA